MHDSLMPAMNYESGACIENFLADEAAPLDARQSTEWLGLSSDDLTS